MDFGNLELLFLIALIVVAVFFFSRCGIKCKNSNGGNGGADTYTGEDTWSFQLQDQSIFPDQRNKLPSPASGGNANNQIDSQTMCDTVNVKVGKDICGKTGDGWCVNQYLTDCENACGNNADCNYFIYHKNLQEGECSAYTYNNINIGCCKFYKRLPEYENFVAEYGQFSLFKKTS